MAQHPQKYIFGEQRTAPNWQGKWFMCYGWRVFPRRLKEKVDAQLRTKGDQYHHQIAWSIQEDIQARGKIQARKMAEEFLCATRHASNHRPLMLDVQEEQFLEHGWKHFTHDDLKYFGQRALHPERSERLKRMKPAAIRELFRRAVQRAPKDVAFLRYCVPQRIELQKMAKHYLGRKVSIPSVGDLAAEYVETIHQSPISRDAKVARGNLRILISKKTVSGFSHQRGPKAKLRAAEYLNEAYLVAQALIIPTESFAANSQIR